MRSLGELIRNARTKKGISQKELAKKLGVSINFMSLMERDISKIPLYRLAQIIKILNLKQSDLIDFMAEEYKKNLKKELI